MPSTNQGLVRALLALAVLLPAGVARADQVELPLNIFNTGLLLTYAYMYSDTIRQPMHFLRPGIDMKLEFEIPIAKWFLIGIGWASQFYIPQRIGGSPATAAKPNRAIWHIGQGFILLHFRIPHTTIL